MTEVCDYLVIGGGATGMAFSDTLLEHHSEKQSLRVVVLDQHAFAGGQWHDGYAFLRLHQPSSMYGVETEALEEKADHLATRTQILDYYQRVQQKLEATYNFQFVPNATFDVDQVADEEGAYTYSVQSSTKKIKVTRRLVDARYLQPDIPSNTPAKFQWNKESISCVPVNEINIAENATTQQYFVVIGAGKTGMDTIVYLRTKANVPEENILWVAPNEAWITAREDIGNCMSFMHHCVQVAKEGNKDLKEFCHTKEFLQNGYASWEKIGKIYRVANDLDGIPSQFKDATLSKDELSVLRSVKQVVRQARVQSIEDDGTLVLTDGRKVPLPWKDAANTTFVHCSCGAFQYTKRPFAEPYPIFNDHHLLLQDVYGTPGFCFVGSILARLECSSTLTDQDRNQMSLCPSVDPPTKDPLGPSGGAVEGLTSDHGWVQRLINVRQWYRQPKEFQDWLVSNRLFHLKGVPADEALAMLDETYHVFVDAGLIRSES